MRMDWERERESLTEPWEPPLTLQSNWYTHKKYYLCFVVEPTKGMIVTIGYITLSTPPEEKYLFIKREYLSIYYFHYL